MNVDHPAVTEEYKFGISAKEENGHELHHTRGQSVYDVAEIFSPSRICRTARTRGLRGGWSLDSSALCPVTGKKWDLSNVTEQKKARNSFYKTKPKLLIASPSSASEELSSSEVDMAANMSISQHKSSRTFVFEHRASASAWNLSCVWRLADLSGIYSVDFDGMKLFSNGGSIDGLVNKRLPNDHDHDLSDAIIDGFILEESHGQSEARLDLMSMADMCDPEEEKLIVESMVGIDDVSGESLDPSLIVKARQEEMRGFSERGVYHHVPRRVAEGDREGKFIGVRWVDVNKGTKEVPRIRSKLVGQ